MVKRGLLLAVLGMMASITGLTLPSDVSADVGHPRFFQSQPPQLNHLLHNVPGDESRVAVTVGAPSRLYVTALAINAWNDSLRASPNSLTKYPLQLVSKTDPTLNIAVKFLPQSSTDPTVDNVDKHCYSGQLYHPAACNDYLGSPTTTIWVANNLDGPTTKTVVTHELGHSLWYSDQYLVGSGDPDPGHPVSIMNGSSEITDPDKNDFQTHYEPTYQSADATYPDTWNSGWNAFYQTGDVYINFPTSLVEYGYFWEKLSDTNGYLLSNGYNIQNDDRRQFNGIVLGTRFCGDVKIYNEVGYSGSRPWSPRSQYSCVGAAQSQSAGFLLSTSDRTGPSASTLNIRIKNFSGGTRNVGIFGPNFSNIGCDYLNLGYPATRQCNVPLGRGAYSQLTWFAWDGPNTVSWGYLDFK